MTPAEMSAEAFKLGIFVAALALIRWNLYEQYRVDAFRQRLFSLRKELFEYADSGNISFDDAAYRLLRERMNRLIRFAHRYSMSDLMLSATIDHEAVPQAIDEVAERIDEVTDPVVRTRLQWINFRATMFLGWHLVCGSWFFLAVGLVAYLVGRINAHIKEIGERFLVNLPGLRSLEGHTHRTA